MKISLYLHILKTITMKKTLLITLFLFFGLSTAWSQWTSPGDGTTFTLRDLLEVTNGCVTYVDTLDAYLLHADLTIAPNDRLTVVTADSQTALTDAIGIVFWTWIG